MIKFKQVQFQFQNDLVKIVKHFGWEECVDMKNLNAADISFCIAQVLQK